MSEDFEDDTEYDESESEGSGRSEGLRGPALEKSIREDKNVGKSSNVDVKDIEEAVASQKRSKGHPHPYESGLGRTGRRNADLEVYHREASKNGTSLSAAVHDYTGVETAWRTHGPATAIELIATKMGQDPIAVANHIVQHFNNPQQGRYGEGHLDGRRKHRPGRLSGEHRRSRAGR